MTWEIRAVDEDGTLVSVVEGVNVVRVVDELDGRERAELSIPTLHPDAALLDVFGHEVQLWLDGDFYSWLVPSAPTASRSGSSDTTSVECVSLFSYMHEAFVGGPLPNHITSPHEDTAAVGSPPAAWTITSGVEAAAVVDNNATFWQTPRAIQLNNGEAGQDAYAYQRFAVTAEMVGVPMFAGAEVYVADGVGGAPAYGGAASQERGLMIHRLDSTTFAPLSEPQVARITDETPRNKVVELFTPGVLPASTSEVIEIRYYAPAAWTVWRYAHLRDDRAIAADRVDKTVAVELLVAAAQDTALGWTDRNIGVDATPLGEIISMSWPWWRRDIIGEQIEDLADTFEFRMTFPSLAPGSAVRDVHVAATVGTDLSGSVTLTKADFTSWSLSKSRRMSINRTARQGGGSGAARMEWWEQDLTALGGEVRAELSFGAPGDLLAQLRDYAAEEVARRKVAPKVLRASFGGDDRRPDLQSLARTLRAGDTVMVDLDHGWAQFSGPARVMKKELDGASMVATVDLEAV